MFLPFSKQGQEWEPIALALRGVLGLRAADRLDPWQLAPKVGLTVVDGNEALASLDDEDRDHLIGNGCNRWSGGVYPIALSDGTYICILNPKHSPRRNKITLMEEIVHTHRGHRPSGLAFEGDGLSVRQYDRQQESEAYGVGAAALIPWQTFFRGVNDGRTVAELSEYYEVTPELVTYRIKITGLFAVFRARQRQRA
jgi:hypothetical protein